MLPIRAYLNESEQQANGHEIQTPCSQFFRKNAFRCAHKFLK